ncbi:MAG TPA: PEP-CTERM sorting domain-containing protein [Bryobacteraceae bacterium]|nr:PEP-CTERM sorting domain-containing protein [Bryobacteraceae bacterium]
MTSRFLGGLAAAIVLTVPLMADTVYTYTGNDFNAFTSPTSYSGSDSVTGEITLASPLGDNLTFSSSDSGNASPVSFSFSDGVQTFTNASGLTSIDFNFETNASGQITEWFISLGDGAGSDTIVTSDSGAGVFDYGVMSHDNDMGEIERDPGTWSISSPSSVPEPGSLAFLGVALIAIIATERKLHRRGA